MLSALEDIWRLTLIQNTTSVGIDDLLYSIVYLLFQLHLFPVFLQMKSNHFKVIFKDDQMTFKP